MKKGAKEMKKNQKKKIIFFTVVFIFVGIIVIGIGKVNTYPQTMKKSSGEIFLYGEIHSVKGILEKEIEIWDSYYQQGFRDLFVEMPYYTAEFLNVWMSSEGDAILEEVYQDWNGTAVFTEEVKQFYQEIKNHYPETVFHGTDVGHQYDTTGRRYLEYLKLQGEEDSNQYKLAEEAIAQGMYYYEHSDSVYRENCMVENFIREFDQLNGVSVMGIYGTAHTDKEAMDYATQTIPCMANQLYQHYGVLVKSEDLTEFAYLREPLEMGTITIAGKEYQASYFGRSDLSAFFPEYQYREFWRVENAYDDWKESATTGNVLPYNNYPMMIEEKQVFVVDYIKTDGTVERMYYRSDGNTWQGVPTTEEFLAEKEG